MSTDIFQYANNVSTTLANPVAPSDTSIILASATNLPTLTAGNIFTITLNDAATQSVFEIVYVTAITGTTLTVVRGQEGTAAASWLVGDFAYAAVTAGELGTFQQISEPVVGSPLVWSNVENTVTNNFSSLTQLNATSYTIPANSIVLGTVIELEIKFAPQSTGTPTFGVEFQIGGNSTGLFSFSAPSLVSSSRVLGWTKLVCSQAGSSGVLRTLSNAFGLDINAGATIVPYNPYVVPFVFSIDTTTTNTVAFWGQCSAASVSNQILMEAWTVSIMYPSSVAS